MKVALCVPTRNAGAFAEEFLGGLEKQTLAGLECLAIDSMSTDGTADQFARAGFRIHRIAPENFDHGGTRSLAVELCNDADILVFMTQDAILADDHALQSLVDVFTNPGIGAAYGRQVPSADAGLEERYARTFNFPPGSRNKTLADRASLGIKAAFFSNTFGAYRREALAAVGGFPVRQIFGEDMYVAANMLLAGWQIGYVSCARVYHSHDLDLRALFRRNFDIGVFHAENPWLLQAFGRPEGEGLRLLRGQLQAYRRECPWQLHQPLVRSLVKYSAYRMGRMHSAWPLRLKQRLSSHPSYWSRN